MRSYESASASWQTFIEYKSLSSLRAALQDDQDLFASRGLRSASWKAFLLCKHCDTSKWPAILQSSRAAYSDLRTRFMHNIAHADEVDSMDPLNDDANSPWNTMRKDEAERQEILQDVNRCMPDNQYFRQPSTQDMLLDILFVWAKLNPDIKYRQGMHEVLAPIVWTIERDAIEATDGLTAVGDDSMSKTFDATFIEHDSFTIFNHVMQNIKSAYETTPVASATLTTNGRPMSRSEPPMVVRGRRILEHDLARVDPPLSQHLVSLEIIPQIFLLRWIRLLFGREVPFDDLLMLWDSLFAEDPSLESIDLICVSMLLRIRWQLLDSDYNAALTLVLRYPQLPATQPPSTLVGDALYLKTHFTLGGGAHIIGRTTGRPPTAEDSEMKEETNAKWSANVHAADENRAPSSEQKTIGNIEGIVQDAARSLLARGQKWGVGKAVREAVGEVRKNVNQLSEQARHSRTISRASGATAADSSDALIKRVSELEERNKALAKMLESAVISLWDHHKNVSETHTQGFKQSEALTMAIASVQLTQVYLEDNSIPLPAQDEVGDSLQQQSSPSSSAHTSSADTDRLAASINDDQPLDPSTPQRQSKRPALHESPFSWMLGQEEKGLTSPRSAFISASPFSAKDVTSSRVGESLFGDPLDDIPFRGKSSQSAKAKSKSKSKAQPVEPDENVFDLGSFQSR